MTIRLYRRCFSRGSLVLAIAVLCLAGESNCSAQSCAGVSATTTGSVTWNPQWCQEFNAASPGPPDTTLWSFDLGNSGFGNNEVETYCGPPGAQGNPSQCPGSFSASTSNAYIDGQGHLLIQALNNGGSWTSARMKTQGLENFQYGRIEASIQLPDTTNQGLWPAFWTLGSNIATVPWPRCGESDIMEVWSAAVLSGPGPNGNRSTIHTAITDGAGLQPNGRFSFANGANDTAFHAYGMIWSANMIQYYVDDPANPYYITTASDLSASDTWPFNLQLFLIMNLAVGGTLGGTPSASTPNPAIMMVDYVRQYQPAAALAAPVLGNPSAITVKAGSATGNSSVFTPGLSAGTGYVYFSCSTNAPTSSCSIATNDSLNGHVVNSSGSETVTVSVSTTANAIVHPHRFDPRPWLPGIVVAEFLAFSIFAVALRRRISSASRVWAMVAFVFLAAVTIAGCGGGSGSLTTPPSNSGTTPGNYSVTVYAFTESNTSDGTNAHADASAIIPLTVN